MPMAIKMVANAIDTPEIRPNSTAAAIAVHSPDSPSGSSTTGKMRSERKNTPNSSSTEPTDSSVDSVMSCSIQRRK